MVVNTALHRRFKLQNTIPYLTLALYLIITYCHAWTTTNINSIRKETPYKFNFHLHSTAKELVGHGENNCFLPLKQLDQDYCAPRIVQV